MDTDLHRPILSFGEVLWDLLPDGPALGGAPLNFAARMQAFGHPTQIISRVGQDSLGQQALLGIQKLGLSSSCIQEDAHQPTGTVEIQLDGFGNADYHILQSVAYDDILLPNETELLVPRAKVLYFGSLVQRSLRARQTLKQIVASLPEDAMIVYDLNLRKDCYSRETIHASLEMAQWMKCNEEESRWVADTFELKANSLPDRAVEILERWHLEGVVMTLGSKGALAVTCSGQIVYQPGFQVQALETIGAGDATTAAFVHHWLAKDPLPFCLRRGCALGSMVTTQHGATQSISMNELNQWIRTAPLQVMDPTLEPWCKNP